MHVTCYSLKQALNKGIFNIFLQNHKKSSLVYQNHQFLWASVPCGDYVCEYPLYDYRRDVLHHYRLSNQALSADCCTAPEGKECHFRYVLECRLLQAKSHSQGVQISLISLQVKWWFSSFRDPEIGFCFEPCTTMRMKRMWAGRCISDEWAANLCKEACQFYLHEQLVVKEQCRVQQWLVFLSCDYWGRCEKCD